jgi:membrane protease YdiL (CAAX protease family)
MPSGLPNPDRSMRASIWKRLLLFALGAAACVIGYLWLLGLSFLGLASPTAGVIPALALALATFALSVRFLRADGLSLADIGCTLSRWRAAQFGYGFVGGGLLTGAWIGIVALAMGARWHWNPSFGVPALAFACAFAFFNNAAEELVYRAYAFVRIADRFGNGAAVVSTSLVFALLHLQAGIPWLNVVSGLRPSSASMIAPAYPPMSDSISMRTALVEAALLNVLVAALLARSWRQAEEPRSPRVTGERR